MGVQDKIGKKSALARMSSRESRLEHRGPTSLKFIPFIGEWAVPPGHSIRTSVLVL